jgi:hypothetical protein
MEFNKVTNFLWKHRGKLTIVAAAAIAAGVYFGYNSNPEGQTSTINGEVDNTVGSEKENIQLEKTLQATIKLREEFNTCGSQLFPTLKLKITEVVDIFQTIKQIKDLRINSKECSSPSASEAEAELWEEIKILSFTLWFVSIYATVVVAIVLKLQIALLRRESILSSSTRSDYDQLLQDTFSYVFTHGIQKFSVTARNHFQKSLHKWTVREKITLHFDEFMEFVNKTRHTFESEGLISNHDHYKRESNQINQDLTHYLLQGKISFLCLFCIFLLHF